MLADLSDAVHITTRAKTLGASAAGDVLSAEEKRRAASLAERLSVAILARAWQILLKGLEEVAEAPNPMAAAEMVLIRLAYTADLPAPDEIIKALGGGAIARPGTRPAPAAEKRPVVSSPSPVDILEDENREEPEFDHEVGPLPAAPSVLPIVRSFADVVALAGERREAKLKVHLEEHVSLVRFDADQIELHLLPGAPKELGNELREKLNAWTGKRWMVALSAKPGEPPIGQVQREAASAELAEIEKHPAVAAVLQQFPEAKISGVRPLPGIKTDDTGSEADQTHWSRHPDIL